MATNSSRSQNLDDLQAIVVSWDGPWPLGEAREWDSLSGNGLYLIIGRIKYTRGKQIVYCGITERCFSERLDEHEKDGRFDDVVEKEVWFGSIDFPKRYNRSHLLRAEKMVIREWNPVHNKQGKISLPNPTCLIMRWYFRFDPVLWRPRSRRPSFMRDKADVLWSERGENDEELRWHGTLKQPSERV